ARASRAQRAGSAGAGAGAGREHGGQRFVVRLQAQRLAPGAGELPAELGLAHAGVPGPAQRLLRDRFALVVDAFAGLPGADAGHAADADRLQRAAVRGRVGVLVEVAVAVGAQAPAQPW